MARAKLRLTERNVFEFGQRVLRLASRSAPQKRPLDRLVVKSGGTTRFVRVADIDCIEAAGVYVSLHVTGRRLLYRATLQELDRAAGRHALRARASIGSGQHRERRAARREVSWRVRRRAEAWFPGPSQPDLSRAAREASGPAVVSPVVADLHGT